MSPVYDQKHRGKAHLASFFLVRGAADGPSDTGDGPDAATRLRMVPRARSLRVTPLSISSLRWHDPQHQPQRVAAYRWSVTTSRVF